jgi:hypothetical protein
MYLALNSQLTTGRVPWPDFARLAAKVGFRGVDVMLGAAFKQGVPATNAYVEVYDPVLLTPKPPAVGVQVRLVDRKTGQMKQDTGLVNMAKSIQSGSSIVPVGLRLPTDKLDAGAYRLELTAMDSTGQKTAARSADFDLE